jgi:hypothetical protein
MTREVIFREKKREYEMRIKIKSNLKFAKALKSIVLASGLFSAILGTSISANSQDIFGIFGKRMLSF